MAQKFLEVYFSATQDNHSDLVALSSSSTPSLPPYLSAGNFAQLIENMSLREYEPSEIEATELKIQC